MAMVGRDETALNFPYDHYVMVKKTTTVSEELTTFDSHVWFHERWRPIDIPECVNEPERSLKFVCDFTQEHDFINFWGAVHLKVIPDEVTETHKVTVFVCDYVWGENQRGDVIVRFTKKIHFDVCVSVHLCRLDVICMARMLSLRSLSHLLWCWWLSCFVQMYVKAMFQSKRQPFKTVRCDALNCAFAAAVCCDVLQSDVIHAARLILTGCFLSWQGCSVEAGKLQHFFCWRRWSCHVLGKYNQLTLLLLQEHQSNNLSVGGLHWWDEYIKDKTRPT